MGKDFLEKRSKIFLLLLLMDKLVSGWDYHSCVQKKKNNSSSGIQMSDQVTNLKKK